MKQKTRKKRFLALLMAAALVFSSGPMTALAEEGNEVPETVSALDTLEASEPTAASETAEIQELTEVPEESEPVETPEESEPVEVPEESETKDIPSVPDITDTTDSSVPDITDTTDSSVPETPGEGENTVPEITVSDDQKDDDAVNAADPETDVKDPAVSEETVVDDDVIASLIADIEELGTVDDILTQLKALQEKDDAEELDKLMESVQTLGEIYFDQLTDEQRALVTNGNVLEEIINALNGDVMLLDGEMTPGKELQEALKNGGEYVLTEDMEIEEEIQITNEVSFNLNGHTLTWKGSGSGFVIVDGGDLTIGNGTIESERSYLFDVYGGGKLTVNDGEYTAAKYVIYLNTASADKKIYALIKDGTFKGTGSGYMIWLDAYTELQVDGGIFEGENGIVVYNSGKVSEAPHRLTEEQYNTPVKLIWGQEEQENGPELLVAGAAIYGNYWYSPTDITINSGKIISENDIAIYHPQQGTFTMNGGLIEGASGIDAKEGNFTFNGGYVVGTGAKRINSAEDVSGQSEANGSPLVFETEFYGSGDDNHGNSYWPDNGFGHYPDNNGLSVTINDGVFISKNNSAVTVYEWNWCEQNVKFDIQGGRFSSFPETIVVKQGPNDGEYYGEPACNTFDYSFNYLSDDDGTRFAPAAHYDGVALEYGYTGADAPFYASMADAIADRDNDPDARAYIYYLLDNGLAQDGTIDRQLQIFYNLDSKNKNESLKYIPDSLKGKIGTNDGAVFGYSFNPENVTFNPEQYVLTDNGNVRALWSPAVTYDANGGRWADTGTTSKTVLATAAAGAFDGDGYGYVVDNVRESNYVTLDENGKKLDTPAGTLLVNPQKPTYGRMTFLGWYYDKEGTKPFNPASTQIKENLTVYAKWTEPEATNWATSKSKTATNLDENYESQVTLSLPAAGYQPEIDVVFVIDDTHAGKDIFTEPAKKLLGELEAKDNLQVNLGVVTFDAVARDWIDVTSDGAYSGLVSLKDEAGRSAINRALEQQLGYDQTGQQLKVGATNLEWPLEMAEEILASGNGTEKHVILFSDMYGYVYRGSMEINGVTYENIPVGKNIYSNKSQAIMGMGTKYNNFADVLSHREEASETADSFFRESSWNNYWSVYSGLAEIPEKPVWSAVPSYSMSGFEVSCCLVYDRIQSLVQNAHVTIVNNDFNPEPTDTPYGQKIKDELLDMLEENGVKVMKTGRTPTADEISSVFDSLKNELIQVVDSGSKVVDVIGSGKDSKGNAYDFVFVNDISKMDLTVAGEKLAKTSIDSTTYGFGDAKGSKDGTTYPFVLHYYADGEDGKSDECFVWDINVAVTVDRTVQLTYTVQLTNPQKEAGTYGQYDMDGSRGYADLYTNNSATLYPVDSEGGKGLPEEFQKPTVSYIVKETTPQPQPDPQPQPTEAKINITKKVADSDGNAKKVDQTFYAAVFSDAAYKNMVGSAVELKLVNASETTAAVTVAVPADGTSRTYYVMETDKDGNIVQSGGDFGYQIMVKGGDAAVSSSNASADVTITNKEVEKSGHKGHHSSSSSDNSSSATTDSQLVSSAQTGDSTNIILPVLMLLLAVALLGGYGIMTYRRKKRS